MRTLTLKMAMKDIVQATQLELQTRIWAESSLIDIEEQCNSIEIS